ncbi:MAG TPA: hypothetical protein ENJ08_08245 [Gammaproteobacteria bacterium]|nr:hypothetical protein [Gammaproteobacteria bacterium]
MKYFQIVDINFYKCMYCRKHASEDVSATNHLFVSVSSDAQNLGVSTFA